MDDKLAHLSDEQIQEIIDRYYKGEKIGILIKEYEIKTQPGKLVSLFPPKVLDATCLYCNQNYLLKYISRDSYSWKKSDSPYCPECKHEMDGRCHCTNCLVREKARNELQKQKTLEFLQSALKTNNNIPVEYNSLTDEEKVYIGALLREGIDEDFNYIKPLQEFINPYAPTEELQLNIIGKLIDKKIIVIHPESDYKAFIIDLNLRTYSYYPLEVKFKLNVHHNGLTKVQLIQQLISPPKETITPENAYIIWKKIAMYESIEYLTYSVKAVFNKDYAVGDKTTSVIEDLLSDFSVGQIYHIFWKCTTNALRFKTESGVPAKHAANTIIGNALSYAEKAKNNNWELKNFIREKNCPQTALSKFFFDRIIGIGDKGFYDKPVITITGTQDLDLLENNKLD